VRTWPTLHEDKAKAGCYEVEATRATLVRTWPTLHEDKAKAGCYEVEAELLTWRPRWRRGLNISGGETHTDRQRDRRTVVLLEISC